MILRLSGLIGTFILALILAKTLGSSSVFGSGDETKTELPLKNNQGAAKTLEVPNKTPAATEDVATKVQDFYRRAESGQRTSRDIEEELVKLTADATPIHWNGRDIKQSYKLTLVASHIKNLDNQFEILFLHTLADHGTAENMTTYYTGKINSADEKSLKGSLTLARLIEVKKGHPQFHPNSRGQYFFSLKPDTFAGTFGLRTPEGTYQMGPVKDGAFDPLSILTSEDGQIDEVGDYQYERTIAGNTYSILVVPRITDYETLIVEIKIREINSLVTTTYILVYEQL